MTLKENNTFFFIRKALYFLKYESPGAPRYTSLGNASNTLPNPQLQGTDRLGNVMYLPAHKLKDGTKERNGRL